MSPLCEALLDLAEAMEADAGTVQDLGGSVVLRCHARTLRALAKSHDKGEAEVPEWAKDPMGWARRQNARDRAERPAPVREPMMVLVNGGEYDGTMVPVDPDMPEGARMLVGHRVYELRGGQLVPVPLPG